MSSYNDTIAQMIAASAEHGSKAVGQIAIAVPGNTSVQYNTQTNVFRDMNSGSEQIVSAQVGCAPTGERIRDNGIHIGATRQKLADEIKSIESRLEDHDGFNPVTGAKRYFLQGEDRERMQQFLENTKRNHVYAHQELDQLQAQRDNDALIKDQAASEEIAREERIVQYTLEEIERAEGRQRAQQFLARKRGGYGM